MNKQIRISGAYVLLAAIALFSGGAWAALTKVTAQPRAEEAIVDDEIVPETPTEEETEVVVVKRAKPKTVVKRVVRERAEITPTVMEDEALAAPVPEATKPSAGSQLDAGIKTKMEDVQSQFEQALLKTLDRIRITVDDGTTPQGSATPTQSAIVQDNLVASQAAPRGDYMSVEAAPVVDGGDSDDFESDGASVAEFKEKKKSGHKVRFAPVFGKSSIGSDWYDVSARYTAGFELEMDIENNFAVVLGYSYSQYNIGLAGNSPFVGYYQPYGGYNGNFATLQYNQNLFEGGMRLYLMPKEAKFRVFGGAGVGYNVGYLNYNQNRFGSNQFSPYFNNATDYEVKSWLGILSAGAAFNVSENVSIGAIFKYGLVFSASQNQPLNNYAFVNNWNQGGAQDAAIVGGSLANENIYSILGTVKVAF